MLLKDAIEIISKIEQQCEKEINVIKFCELNPDQIQEIVFVPDFYYDGMVCEKKEAV
jgi:hypothetical protein